MATRRCLSRRSFLLGGAAATLTACRAAGGRGVTAPSAPARHDQPGDESGAAADAAPAAPLSSPVELVWQAAGGPDRLRLPTGLAVGRRGALTVVDAGHDRLVQLATGDGEAIARIGGPGDAPGQFRFESVENTDRGPVRTTGGGVAADAVGSLYIADPFNRRIQQLDQVGRVASTWRDAPIAGSLGEPAAVAVDARRGRVYVVDAGAHRVHAFDRDGRRLTEWGGLGRGEGAFVRPAAVAVDRTGLVYVADRGNDRIQVFDAGGRFVTIWGGPGPQPDGFWGPTGVAVDGSGRVYVAAAARHGLTTAQRVLVFSAAGVFLGAWDGPGGDGEAFGALGGVAVDEQGAVYVADQFPARVLKFRPRRPWPTPAAARPTPRPATPTATAGPSEPPPVPMTPTDR